MKSRLNKLYDYRQVELEKEAVVEGVKKEVDDIIRYIVKNYKTVLNVDSIETGDVATFKTESDFPKYNKNVLPVNVGKNLYDEDFEKAVIGLKAGETKTIEVKEHTVNVTVISIKRTVYPEITDVMVAEHTDELDEDLQGIKTVAELITKAKEKFQKSIRETMIYNGVNVILGEMYDNSEWNFDENEIKEYAKTVYEEETAMMNSEGINLDELKTEEDFLKAFGDIRSREELEDVLTMTAKQTIAVELICCEMFNLNPDEACLGEENSNSEKLVDFLYKYITDNINFIEEE